MRLTTGEIGRQEMKYPIASITTMKDTLLAFFAATAILSSPIAANAELVEGLCDGTPDSTVTCDSATGLEWLDLTQTTGFSVNAVLGGAGGFLDAGWTVADLAAVELLFIGAGWDGVDVQR